MSEAYAVGQVRSRTFDTGAQRRLRRFTVPLIALLAYLPFLLGARGKVTSDTKIYLYLDPARLLHQIPTLWNPDMGMGTVSHQQIGYLFPIGPYFWLTNQLGVPLWIAQRLWMGSILFAAGGGVVYLARKCGLKPEGVALAALAYELSPYLLQYTGQTSVVLLSWAALGWLVGLAISASQSGRWRPVVLFALVATAAGSTNATALFLVGLAVIVWFPFGVLVTKEVSVRDALITVAKLSVASLVLSAWWLGDLIVEKFYGFNILSVTETVPQISHTSLSSEVLRGLGYWYFYGSEVVGPWHLPSIGYETSTWLLIVSFLIPALALMCAGIVRWRHRAYFASLVVVGVIVSVGVYPYSHPSVFGALLRAFTSQTAGVGAALRNLDRAGPLVALGAAMLFGAGAEVLIEKLSLIRPRTSHVVFVVLIGLIVANLPSIWDGNALTPTFLWPGKVPSYYNQAAAYLNSRNKHTRVLIEPGNAFSAYNWGYTADSVWPALLKRPTVERRQVPEGTTPSVQLQTALDEPVQQEIFNPASFAPIARLMSAGDMVWQSNLEWQRNNSPLPRLAWLMLGAGKPPPGLGKPVYFGPLTPDHTAHSYPSFNEQNLSLPAGSPLPPALAVFPVPNPRPVVRTESTASPLIVDGSSSGLVEAASTGLLNASPTILYSGSLVNNPAEFNAAMKDNAQLVLTDTNRKRAEIWTSLRGNFGYTETANEIPQPNAYDARLNLFPGAPISAWSVSQLSGVQSVTASSYSTPSALDPSFRPQRAIDENDSTAWEIYGSKNPDGQWWQVKFLNPIVDNHIRILQPSGPKANRWITKVTLTFNGGSPEVVNLNMRSRVGLGQMIYFPTKTFTTLRVTIDSTNFSGAKSANFYAAAPVGLSDVSVVGNHAIDTIALPTDMLTAAGPASINHRLTILMSRNRNTPYPPATDSELTLTRTLQLPTPRTFSVSGTAGLSTLLADRQIDQALSGTDAPGGVVASSSGYLSGSPANRASAAFDGNLSTFWSSPFGKGNQVNSWVQAHLPKPITFDHLNLAVVADGRHSVPTVVEVSTRSGARIVNLPPIADLRQRGHVVSVPINFAPLHGSTIRLTIKAVRFEYAPSVPPTRGATLPVAIAEVGIPGVAVPDPPLNLPSTCRSNLLSINGLPVFIRISGTTAAAQMHAPLHFQGCGPDKNGVQLNAGPNVIVSTPGNKTGFDINSLALDSAPGGSAMPLSTSGTLQSATSPPSPVAHVVASSQDSYRVLVKSSGKPYWLVVGQGYNAGWRASIVGGPSLGPPQLIDGYANGWLVNPSAIGTTTTFRVTWAPQQIEDVALGVSAVGGFFALLVFLSPWAPEASSRKLRLRRRQAAGSSIDGWTPTLGWPYRSDSRDHRELSRRTRLSVSVACGVVAALLLPPFVAGSVLGVVAMLFAAALTVPFMAAALQDRRYLRVLMAAPGVTALVMGAYVVFVENLSHVPSGWEWVTTMGVANVLGWFVVIFLGMSVVAELALRPRATCSEGT